MLKDIKCLLVDDDADDQDVFKQATDELEVKVQLTIAGSGDEAFEKLNNGKPSPDCIFLDLNMPRMNGREFLKKIKNTPVLKKIPVLIYSTSADAKDKTDMIFLGAARFITKPNSVSELVEILKKELGRLE